MFYNPNNLYGYYKPTVKKVGGLRKIAEIPIPCRHPEHLPPRMIVLEPGFYEHTCPGCGKSVTFTVPRISF